MTHTEEQEFLELMIMNKIKYYYNVAFVSSFKWLYNHCNLFKRFVQKRAKKQGEINLFILEFLMAKEPIDVDYWCDRLSKISNSGTNIK